MMRQSGIAIVMCMIGMGGNAHAGDKTVLDKDGQTVTMACGSREVSITGSRGTITLTGACDEINIKGNENTIRVESAKKLEIWGNSNSIDVVATNTIQAAGNDNRVQYVKGLSKKAPATKLWGKRNQVKRVKELSAAPVGGSTSGAPAGGAPAGGAPAGGAPAGTSPPPAPPKSAALQPAKPVVCERNDKLTLDGVVIETAGIAVTTGASCTLVIRNSKIVSTGNFAITPGGTSGVTLENVEVAGKFASISSGGSADVTIKGSTLRGPLQVGGSATVRLSDTTVHGGHTVGKSATFVDNGGNRFHK